MIWRFGFSFIRSDQDQFRDRLQLNRSDLLKRVTSEEDQGLAGLVLTRGHVNHEVGVGLRGDEAELVPRPLLIGSAGLLLPHVHLNLVLRHSLGDIQHEARVTVGNVSVRGAKMK